MNFAEDISSELSQLKILLRDFIKDEGIIKEGLIFESGFLIKNYSLKIAKFNSNEKLNNLKDEIDRIINFEKRVNSKYKSLGNEIKKFENEYNTFNTSNLKIKNLIMQFIGTLPNLCGLVKQNIIEIEIYLQNNEINTKALPYRIGNSFKSLEKRLNQILKIIQFFDELNKKITKFQKEEYFPNYYTYGRAVSQREYKKMIRKSKLIGSGYKKSELISVFAADPKTIFFLNNLSRVKIKSFFAEIGAIGVAEIIYFKTRLKPKVGPITQKNGLREYKFPKDIPLEIVA